MKLKKLHVHNNLEYSLTNNGVVNFSKKNIKTKNIWNDFKDVVPKYDDAIFIRNKQDGEELPGMYYGVMDSKPDHIIFKAINPEDGKTLVLLLSSASIEWGKPEDVLSNLMQTQICKNKEKKK